MAQRDISDTRFFRSILAREDIEVVGGFLINRIDN